MEARICLETPGSWRGFAYEVHLHGPLFVLVLHEAIPERQGISFQSKGINDSFFLILSCTLLSSSLLCFHSCPLLSSSLYSSPSPLLTSSLYSSPSPLLTSSRYSSHSTCTSRLEHCLSSVLMGLLSLWLQHLHLILSTHLWVIWFSSTPSFVPASFGTHTGSEHTNLTWRLHLGSIPVQVLAWLRVCSFVFRTSTRG